MVREFVDGWDIVQVLGEGAYGEVLLVVNQQTHEAVAAKALELSKESDMLTNIKKEIFIHRLLKHENIIKFIGHREEKLVYFIFLEYAPGGELFDRIEPDHGMPEAQAHKYFCQIISAVEYIHSLGIAHRDLKPENVLLDEYDNVKISDFGFATLFRHNGKERLLNKRCGTLPYVSPEVFTRAYRAEPADIWSCGIMLVAMLAGELPWDKPTVECKEYEMWKEGKFSISPWTKIDNLALALLKKILVHSPTKRLTVAQLKSHLWFKKLHKIKAFTKWEGESIPYKRQRSDIEHSLGFERETSIDKVSCSQPEPFIRRGNGTIDISAESLDVLSRGVSFSQPAHPEDMILCSQLTATPDSSQSPMDKLVVRRMTRFFVKMKAEDAVKALKVTLNKLKYSWKKSGPGQVMVTCLDRRKMQLVFKATLLEMQENILLDFRLSRGDGLEFKREFLVIRDNMAHMIVKGPIIWPLKMVKTCVLK